MEHENCLICDRIQMIENGTNPYFVKELETGYVVIGDHQHFQGYTLFLCKQHVRELHDLELPFKLKHLDEMSLVSEAVHKAFKPDKINIESLGNGDAHLHWHIFPRRKGDIAGSIPGPVWWLPLEKMNSDDNRPSAEVLREYVDKLRAASDSLGRAT